jgi:hypothetical protein
MDLPGWKDEDFAPGKRSPQGKGSWPQAAIPLYLE